MVGNFKVITLCGSSKFKKEFIEVAEKLTLQGNIVISLGLFGHADNKYETVITDDIKEMLDEAHKAKITISDSIFVINPGGYIGDSTRDEISYAESLGLDIEYLEPIKYTYRGWIDSFDKLLKHSTYCRESYLHGDIYMIKQTARGVRDITGNLINGMQFVMYDKILGGWRSIDLLDCEFIVNKDQEKIELPVNAGEEIITAHKSEVIL